MSIVYDLVPPEDIEAAHAIEVVCFSPDEADSLHTLKFRQSKEPSLFLGAYLLPSPSSSQPPAITTTTTNPHTTSTHTRTLIGYISATLSPEPDYTQDSMTLDIPSSPSICIHSICIAPAYRHKGVATGLLREYIRRAQGEGRYERILAIAHEEYREFWERAGFEFVGRSSVVRGARQWVEMRRSLGPKRSS